MEQPNETPSSPPPENGKSSLLDTLRSRQFLAGFFGWYVANGLIWLVLGNPSGEAGLFNLTIFPINLLALIILSVRKPTRKIGLGILAALALNLFIATLLGVIFNGLCFIPFYYR